MAEAATDDYGEAVLEGFKPLQPLWLLGVPMQSEWPQVVGCFAEAE